MKLLTIEQTKSRFFAFVSLTVLSLISTINASADTSVVTLNVNPKQCIAVHQGQKCYVDIEITWVAQQQADYCLFSTQQQDALMCWSGKMSAVFNREIVANENVIFRLKQKGKVEVLVSGELEMAWVYKKNSRARSSWRMF